MLLHWKILIQKCQKFNFSQKSLKCMELQNPISSKIHICKKKMLQVFLYHEKVPYTEKTEKSKTPWFRRCHLLKKWLLINLSTTVKELHHHIKLNKQAMADITWWYEFMPSWNKKLLIPDNFEILSSDIYTPFYRCIQNRFWSSTW